MPFRRETSVGVARCRPDCWLVYYMSQSGLMLLQVSSVDPSLSASALGHFRGQVQNISCENQFYLHEDEKSFLLISEYNDKNLYFVSWKSRKFIVHFYRWRHLMNRFMSLLVNCFVSEVMNVWKSYMWTLSEELNEGWSSQFCVCRTKRFHI